MGSWSVNQTRVVVDTIVLCLWTPYNIGLFTKAMWTRNSTVPKHITILKYISSSVRDGIESFPLARQISLSITVHILRNY